MYTYINRYIIRCDDRRSVTSTCIYASMWRT